jgi:hypothetical protein
MRTKLDEIVEEEIAEARRVYWTASDLVETLGGRIAERAFRHGVEQGAHGAIHATKFIDAVNPEEFSYRVQPEPVGEKKVRCPHYWTGRGDGLCLLVEGHVGLHEFTDRRKGLQRRKGLESRQVYGRDGVVVGIYQFNSNMFWFVDRRIKDRRKS